MENSNPLATDSFSYSWFDGSSEAARIYHNYDKFFKELDLDFDFNFRPEPKSTASLVPADEIFSDGRIKPSSLQASTPASPIIHNIISYSQDISNTRPCPIQQILRSRKCDQYQYYYFLRKLSKSSNKILRNFFAIFRVAKRSRKSIRVDDLDRKVWEVGSLSNSPIKTSPDRNIKLRMDYKDDDDVYCKRLRNGKRWNNSPMASPQGSPSHHIPTYDLESSIHEAILHCKRSFGQ